MKFPGKNKLNKIIKILKIQFGASITLKPKNILDVLIATKLSQNTNDKLSFQAFTKLKNKFPDYSNLAKAKIPEIKKQIDICGLGNKKSQEIKSLLEKIFNKYKTFDLSFIHNWSNEEIYDEFLKYKGFGVKTVSCVLAFAMNRPVFPVDTHIHRILNRIGLVSTTKPEDTFAGMKNLIPDKEKVLFHKNLILFGRSICKSLKPVCGICPIETLCEFDRKKFAITDKSAAINNFLILNNI